MIVPRTVLQSGDVRRAVRAAHVARAAAAWGWRVAWRVGGRRLRAARPAAASPSRRRSAPASPTSSTTARLSAPPRGSRSRRGRGSCSPRSRGRSGARPPRRAARRPPGPRAATPPARAAAASSPGRAPRCAGSAAGARTASLGLDVGAVLVELLRAASSTPSPRAASVLTIGTGQSPCGASVSTPRISRTIVSVSGWSDLLTTMMSGISITPALSAWIESPEPGDQHEHDRVRVVDHVDLGLADADGLQEHVVLAGRVHQQRGLQRRLGEPAERAARGHRADEHARVEEVLGQPDPVAQQRAAAERRARVDRQHGDLALALALEPDQGADQRRLAGAGRPGEADHRRVAGVRIDLADELPALGVVVLHERDRARQRALVARQQPLGEAAASSRPSSRTRIRSVGDGDGRQAAHSPPCPRRARAAAAAVRWRWLRFMRAHGMLNHKYARLIAPLGLAAPALARPAADRRAVLRRPRRQARDRPRRGAAARPLVVDRARDEDPRARGRGRDRREVRARTGVHDLRVPARLDRPRVHRRRPRDADRLRPRRGRDRAPDPPAGDLQARRARRQQLLDRLRRLHPARRHGRRQRDRRHLLGRHEGRARQRGRRRRPGPRCCGCAPSRRACAGARRNGPGPQALEGGAGREHVGVGAACGR